MIKFWKSAAKGKSGCPVRPPERNYVKSSLCALNENDTLDEEFTDIFGKKSKLTATLKDILTNDKLIKHLIEYMQSIGKTFIMKCWADLEQFRHIAIIHSKMDIDANKHSRLSRAKSFDFQSRHGCAEEELSHFQWKINNQDIPSASGLKRSKNDTSSCVNLAGHPRLMKCDVCGSDYHNDIIDEAITLFKKYVALEAPCPLDLPDSIRKLVITNICQPEGQVNEDCFRPVQDELFKLIENKYFNDFQKSPLYFKVQIDILTSGTLSLKDILYNETILFYFTEFLEQESCSILLEFLMVVIHYRDNMTNGNNSSCEQAQADAIVLYDKYFSLQATNPIGFSTDIRLQIESEICREGGPLPTCFDIPYKIVFKTLDKCVKMFLESELYYKYLSEMIHSVDRLWMSRHKSTSSDCSSEFSISTQNTLLAMGDPAFRKKKHTNSVPDMTIDSNQLYNADALWQRKRHDGLSLGRINSLGRFESKFEPDPDKREKSTLKKMVSRFVPTKTGKVEEEMAWQIAHMIVKDVTDLTMAPSTNDQEDPC